MKPAPFYYHDPGRKAEALRLIATKDNVRLRAGGQSLLPTLYFRLAVPDHLVDRGRVAELNGIATARRKHGTIGANKQTVNTTATGGHHPSTRN